MTATHRSSTLFRSVAQRVPPSDRRRSGPARIDYPRNRLASHRAAQPDRAPASTNRSVCRAGRLRRRARGQSGGRNGADRLHGGSCADGCSAGRGCDTRSRRDKPGRYPWDAFRTGRPDHSGRDDKPCGRHRPGNWASLRGRRKWSATRFPARSLTTSDGRVFREGAIITLDGTRGEVMAGASEMIAPELGGAFSELLDWADAVRDLGVRQCGYTGRGAGRKGFPGRRVGPVPNRADVLRRGSHRCNAPHGSRGKRSSSTGGARRTAADAARGLRRALRHHARSSGHDPAARPALARISAAGFG